MGSLFVEVSKSFHPSLRKENVRKNGRKRREGKTRKKRKNVRMKRMSVRNGVKRRMRRKRNTKMRKNMRMRRMSVRNGVKRRRRKNVRMRTKSVMKRSVVNATGERRKGSTMESVPSVSISRKGKAGFFCSPAVKGVWEEKL
jgi:hypothetical protein